MAARSKHLVIDMPLAVESVSPPDACAVWLDDAIFYGLVALLMFGPLAFGATQPWSQFVQRTFAIVLLAMWVVQQCLRGTIETQDNPLLLPSGVFFGFVVLQFLSGLTSYRYATLTEALDLIPCGILIFLAGESLSRRRRLHQFALVMAVFGFAVALFAMFQDFSGTDKIYGIVPLHYVSALVYGPYVNHNHYAGLMEMLTPLAGAAAFLERGARRSLLLFATILMATSVVLSRSRGGMIGLGLSVVFLCAVLYRSDRSRRSGMAILATTVGVALVVLLLANQSVLHRLTETQDNYRVTIYADCIRMWWHKPLFGFGWGTFPTVYPQFRSFYINLFINRAHNDYLEMLVDTGLVGVILTGWFLFAVVRGGWQKISDRIDHEGGTLALGLMAGITALLAHSALDFNLHIPANAAMFYVLCAAAATPFRHSIRHAAFTTPARKEAEMEMEPIPVDGPA